MHDDTRTQEDSVDHPKHYNSHPSGLECIDVIEEMTFNIGSAIKYLWRAGLKPGEPMGKDLAKAKWYIEREIQRLGRDIPAPVEMVASPEGEEAGRVDFVILGQDRVIHTVRLPASVPSVGAKLRLPGSLSSWEWSVHDVRWKFLDGGSVHVVVQVTQVLSPPVGQGSS